MFFFTGEDWLSDEAEDFKKLITDKIGAFIKRPIVIGSLTTFLNDRQELSPIHAPRNWFLLLDIHRVVLYDDDFSENHARIGDLSFFINDITSANHLRAVDLYGANHPVIPTDFERVLNILPVFLQQDRPGWAVDLNTVTGIINYACASKHPLSKADQSQRVSDQLIINPLQIGSNGRGLTFRKLEPDISTESNIVRLSDLRINDLSISAGRSMVVWREGIDKFICGGKSIIPADAEMISVCESLERFQVMYHPPDTELVRQSYNELGDKAVNPDTLFFNTRNKTFDPDAPIYWAEAFELKSGNRKLVPAQEIWFDTTLLKDETVWITNTTSGCAVGGSFEEALLFGILEKVERDSFLSCWYLKKTCRRIEPDSLVHEHLNLLLSKLRYLKPNYEVTFLDLRNDLNVPTVLVTAVRKTGTGPKFFCAVASALNYAAAAFSALKDVQNLLCFPPTREQTERFETLIEDQTKVSDPEDHQGIYTIDSMFEKLAFFDSGETVHQDELEFYELTNKREKIYDIKSIIGKLENNCRKVGAALYCRDISHHSLKMKNLSCVKVISENLFPIWYGYYNNRISINDRLKQMAISETGKIISGLDDIDTGIHPFG